MADDSARGPRGDAPDDGTLSHLWRSVFRGSEEPVDTGSIDSIIHLELTRVGDDDAVTPSRELLEIFPESREASSGIQSEAGERETGAAGAPEPQAPPRVEPPPGPASEESKAREDLEARLSHPEAGERLAALRVLRRRSERASIASVSARLRDPSPEVRSMAVSVLERIGGDSDLILLLDVMHDPSEEVRRAARGAILGRPSPSLVELLRRELDAPTRCEAAAELLAEMDEIETLVAAMAGQDPNIRRMIRHTLASTGLPQRLIRDLRDPSPVRRRLAAERLGTLRESAAVDELIRRLEDPDAVVRVEATKALEAIGDAEAIRYLRQTLLVDPETRVATAAGEALRRLTGGTSPD